MLPIPSAHPAQTQEFVGQCRERLGDNGILLANHWCSEFSDSRRAREALQAVFGDQVLYLDLQGGNTIDFGSCGGLPRLQH